MKKKALLLATALSALVHQGNFANTKNQIVDHTKHQIAINFAEQANKQDTKTFYVAGTQEQLSDKHPDSLNHQAIITMQMDDILVKYGKEKGLDIIRQHMLIEINLLRKNNDRPLLLLDPVLNTAAQEFAEQGNLKKKMGHDFDGKGIDIDLSKYSATAQNVAYDATATIASVVNDWYTKSEGHKKTMLGMRTSEHTGKAVPYVMIGIGVSGSFIVAEFATPEK